MFSFVPFSNIIYKLDYFKIFCSDLLLLTFLFCFHCQLAPHHHRVKFNIPLHHYLVSLWRTWQARLIRTLWGQLEVRKVIFTLIMTWLLPTRNNFLLQFCDSFEDYHLSLHRLTHSRARRTCTRVTKYGAACKRAAAHHTRVSFPCGSWFSRAFTSSCRPSSPEQIENCLPSNKFRAIWKWHAAACEC